VEIDGLPAMRIETWDRLTHDHRESWLFVINRGNLLVLRMEMGRFARMQPAFDAMVNSLEFHSVESTT
jgi:hypothetical protein